MREASPTELRAIGMPLLGDGEPATLFDALARARLLADRDTGGAKCPQDSFVFDADLVGDLRSRPPALGVQPAKLRLRQAALPAALAVD